MWALRQTTAPTEPLISTSDAKLHLRVEHDSEDALIDRIVAAATERAEMFQMRAYLTQTFRLTLPRFPTSRIIRLPRPPLQSVTSITYIDSDGDEQTFNASNYRVDLDADPGRIILDSTASWPNIVSDIDAVKITYVAGYGEASDVPEQIRSAVLLLVGHLYENREAITIGTGPTFKLSYGPEYLLWPQRVFEFDPIGG